MIHLGCCLVCMGWDCRSGQLECQWACRGLGWILDRWELHLVCRGLVSRLDRLECRLMGLKGLTLDQLVFHSKDMGLGLIQVQQVFHSKDMDWGLALDRLVSHLEGYTRHLHMVEGVEGHKPSPQPQMRRQRRDSAF